MQCYACALAIGVSPAVGLGGVASVGLCVRQRQLRHHDAGPGLFAGEALKPQT
jgi:hypothetical protein